MPTRQRLESLILDNLKWMLDRSERFPDSSLVETKVNLITGQDFLNSDKLRGRNMIFCWVQGRAMESLAGHHAWIGTLDLPEKSKLLQRIEKILLRMVNKMESLRSINGGHLFFMMDNSGQPKKIDREGNLITHEIQSDAPSNFSDLFYAKGLVAAAHILENQTLIETACSLMNRIADDILGKRFESDQQSLDPSNPIIANVPGRHLHAPYMIAIGAAALFLEITGRSEYKKLGIALIDHILQNYVHISTGPLLTQPFDMWEYTDDQGLPYEEANGVLRSLPGHCTEFAGLGLKFIRQCENVGNLTDYQQDQIVKFKAVLPQIVLQNFKNGFADIGICNAVDLNTRKIIQGNMPWWNLPETIRSACECQQVVPLNQREYFCEMSTACTKAFFENYILPDNHQLAIQTLNQEGVPVDAIPAVPDVDPCYHTGLSLIDVLNLQKNR